MSKAYEAAKVLFRPESEKYTWRLISQMNNLFPRFIFKQMSPSFSNIKYSEAKAKITKSDIEAIRKMNNRQRSSFGFLIDLNQVNELTLEDIQAVTCPTLLMHSKHDASVPLEHAYYA